MILFFFFFFFLLLFLVLLLKTVSCLRFAAQRPRRQRVKAELDRRHATRHHDVGGAISVSALDLRELTDVVRINRVKA